MNYLYSNQKMLCKALQRTKTLNRKQEQNYKITGRADFIAQGLKFVPDWPAISVSSWQQARMWQMVWLG